MVKIKQKKTMNLPQLIEWAWDNDVRDKNFKCKEGNELKHLVYINPIGKVNLDSEYYYDKNDLFTVEVEEEITEDTELDLVLRFIDGDKAYYSNSQTMSINTCLESEPDDITNTHFYIENDDRELVLIWRDGKMVE